MCACAGVRARVHVHFVESRIVVLEMNPLEVGTNLPLASMEMDITIAVLKRVLKCIGSLILFFKLPNR